jgi:glutathione synthase/RimK-type ligase-like ATP-grasp enzyme
MGKRCAYLTMDDISNFVSDADLSFAPMVEQGWEVEMVPWRGNVDWSDYDLVYICTPWDYQNDVTGFLDVLETIEDSSARLVNSLNLVRWNLEKTYLRDLEVRGADIVPSRFFDNFDEKRVTACFDAYSTDTIVLKPVVGANSDNIFVLTGPVPDDVVNELRHVFVNRPFFVQPFINSVRSEGEYSLFFFGGEYSHAILKKPKRGDFRSQEEHGADILSVEAPAALVDTAHQVLGVVNPRPVYVRADFLRGTGERFLLVELELIEPALYFRTDPESATRFARALTRAAAGT